MRSEEKHFLNVEQAASFLSVSPGKIRKDLREHLIPHARIGRRIVFDPDRLTRWVSDHAVEPASDERSKGSP
jgi:excisionase family DNA binding protein